MDKKQFERTFIKLCSIWMILTLSRAILFHIRNGDFSSYENPLAMFDLMGKILMLSGFLFGFKWHGVGGWLILGGFAMLEIIPGPIIGERKMFVKYIYPVWGVIYIGFWISDNIARVKKKKQ